MQGNRKYVRDMDGMKMDAEMEERQRVFRYDESREEVMILQFLADVAANNRREWLAENQGRYKAATTAFARLAEQMIAKIGEFDPTVAGLSVQSTLYRFYRDTRFSADKSPYKRHFGSYINARGRKSQHGGYYLHLEPGSCLLGGGSYSLEPPVLKAVRTTVMERIDEFRAIVEAPAFVRRFPEIGWERLKTLPVGFPRDFAYPQYLRPKDYSVACHLPDTFFLEDGWMDRAADIFRLMKPMMDFVNDVVDDYI